MAISQEVRAAVLLIILSMTALTSLSQILSYITFCSECCISNKKNEAISGSLETIIQRVKLKEIFLKYFEGSRNQHTYLVRAVIEKKYKLPNIENDMSIPDEFFVVVKSLNII